MKLCGYKNGGDRKSESHNETLKLSLDEIASQLGTSKTNLQRALTIERNLTESMKQLLDDGVISKTVAAKKVGKRIKELERLYGIQNGSISFQGNQYEVVTNKSEAPKKTQEQLAAQMGISVDTLQNYKILSEMIPELEELLDTGVVTKYFITIQMNDLVCMLYMCYAYFILLVWGAKENERTYRFYN